MESRGKRGRPRLRGEDCVEIRQEGEGRMRVKNGGVETAVKRDQ